MRKTTKRKRGAATGGASKKTAPKKAGRTEIDHQPEFPIVGIGASAGGVEAFTKLLENLAADSGMAFVLVPHLAPAHKSELALVLSRKSNIPIAEAKHHQQVEPNRIYVIPPNKQMILERGHLRLSAREDVTGPPRSIDLFFESLAREQGQRAIGVILSGTATDGTLGLEAIKGEGGFTFAQDSSARYDSMPRNAVLSGCVDFVLPPEAIARELVRIGQHPFLRRRALEVTGAERALIVRHETDHTSLPAGGQGTPHIGATQARRERDQWARESQDDPFKPVISLLRNHTGVDFSLYKSSTIQRRISRRMVLNKCSSLADYGALLKRNPKELDSLYSDVLISVTTFFRNPEVFEFLKRKVFPRLFGGRREDPVRVWVLGCSTGQEAYSLAMVLDEFFDKHLRRPTLQIFASDLNEALLAKARSGLYTKTLAHDISPGRLRRFFTEEDGGYRICKSLRDSVVFARQNLIHDPPFSRMDLITCRNVLIYLENVVHRRIIPTFHYALKPSGLLVLGSSESVGVFTDLFEPIDRQHKVYARKPAPTPPLDLGFSVRSYSEKRAGRVKLPEAATPPQINIQREADRVALNRYVPPSVLVSTSLQVLYFRGDTSPYLKPPTGRATFSLLHMIKEGLLTPLRTSITQSIKHHKPVRKEGIIWTDDGKSRKTSLDVVPLAHIKERYYLVFFEENSNKDHRTRQPIGGQDAPGEEARGSLGKPTDWRNRVGQLERSLAESRDYLQSVQEQYEAVNEELQASNEEATSANEELQSTNEELETSKEELESTNEELTTVNEEVANRNAELTVANSDLSNLYINVNMAVVLLSRDLAIRRFTKPAEKLFNLLDTDIGRSINAIRPNLDISDLESLLMDVIESVTLREREVRSSDGNWYVLRARPYFTQDRKVDGAVLLAVDVDQLKKSEQEARTERERAEVILHSTPTPLLVLDPLLRVDFANETFCKTFRTTLGETKGDLVYHLGNGQWNIPRLRTLLEEIIPTNSFIKDFEVAHDFPSIGRRTLILDARRLDGGTAAGHRILISFDDYTDRLQAQQAIRASEVRFRRLFEMARDGIILLDPATERIFDVNPVMRELLGMSEPMIVGKELHEIGLLQSGPTSQAFFRILHEQGATPPTYMTVRGKSGDGQHLEMIANRYPENGHEVIQCNIRDVTERKRHEAAILEAKQSLEEANRSLEERVIERTASLNTLNEHLKALSSQLIHAQEHERQRIGRELHDGIGALLVALKLQLHAILNPLSPEEHGKADTILLELTRQVRQLSLELHPHLLEDLGLRASLDWHIKAYEQRTRISVKFNPEKVPARRLSPDMEITLFRIVQEALTNVARHAETSKAEVRFYNEGRALKVEITDEGKGFSAEERENKTSLGLTGMRERVLLMNGTFEIVSKPGSGTRVSVSLPLES